MATTAQPTVTPTLTPAATAVRAPTSLWRDAFRRLRRNRLAFASLILIGVFTVVALAAPLIAPYDYALQNYDAVTQPPSARYPLGTDQLGRDILSRLIYGARISLSVGIIVQLVVLAIGVPAGLLAGFYGGKIDSAVMRVVDIISALPSLLFVILIMTYLRAVQDTAQGGVLGTIAELNDRTGRLIGVFIGIGLIGWPTVARLVRAQTLSLKEKEFIEAARNLGAHNGAIMLRHILPNTIAPIVVAATIGIPRAILYEAGISFLGLGVYPPMPSWGLMISESIANLRAYPHMLVAPAIALSLTVLAFNFLGDGLRDALDPWMKR